LATGANHLIAAENTVRADEIALHTVRRRLRILGKTDDEIASLEAQPTQKLNAVTIVTAPIAGTITQRQVGIGQYVASLANGATTPVYTISDLSTVWLIANVREVDTPSMHVGHSVEVRVLAYPGHVFKAKISWVAPSIDPNTHRLPVRADVENPDGALKPGMFADFSIITGRRRPTRRCRKRQSSTKAIASAFGLRERAIPWHCARSARDEAVMAWSRFSPACPRGRRS